MLNKIKKAVDIWRTLFWIKQCHFRVAVRAQIQETKSPCLNSLQLNEHETLSKYLTSLCLSFRICKMGLVIGFISWVHNEISRGLFKEFNEFRMVAVDYYY